MSDQQVGNQILDYILESLDKPLNAVKLAAEVPCSQSTASKYLRDFNLPGYAKTRIGHNYVISRNPGAGHRARPRPIPPTAPKPDPLAGFGKFMADEKTAAKITDLLKLAYLAGVAEPRSDR